MFLKIYFGDKPLFLCEEITAETESYLHHDDAILIEEFSSHAVNAMIHEMQQQKVHAGVFVHNSIDELKKAFWKKFTIVTAAGGLVTDDEQRILFIFRRGNWDLPKGKLETGEDLETCAVREVQEETGLAAVSLVAPLLTTYHTYHESGKHILKESHWYEMAADSRQQLTPQVEEDIHDIRWVKEADLNVVMANTFPSIADVVEKKIRRKE